MIKTSTLSLTAVSFNSKQKKSIGQSEAFQPADAVINRLLSYSKALSVKKSKSMGYLENLMN